MVLCDSVINQQKIVCKGPVRLTFWLSDFLFDTVYSVVTVELCVVLLVLGENWDLFSAGSGKL